MPFKTGQPKRGGRQKGTTNKNTTLLKDAILEAAALAGRGSLTLYLVEQAKAQPAAFLTLLGKVLAVAADRRQGTIRQSSAASSHIIVDPKRPDGVDEVMRFGVNARREDEENSPSKTYTRSGST